MQQDSGQCDCLLDHDICLKIYPPKKKKRTLVEECQVRWSLRTKLVCGLYCESVLLLGAMVHKSRAETTKSPMSCGSLVRTCTSASCFSLQQPEVTLQGSPDVKVQGSLDRVFGALKMMSSASIPTFWGWLLLEPAVAVV